MSKTANVNLPSPDNSSEQNKQDNIVPFNPESMKFKSIMDFKNHTNGIYNKYEEVLSQTKATSEKMEVIEKLVRELAVLKDNLNTETLKENMGRISKTHGLNSKSVDKLVDSILKSSSVTLPIVINDHGIHYIKEYRNGVFLHLGEIVQEYCINHGWLLNKSTSTITCKNNSTDRSYSQKDFDVWYSDLQSVHRTYFVFDEHKPSSFFLAMFNPNNIESYDVVSDHPVVVYYPDLKVYTKKDYPLVNKVEKFHQLLDFYDNVDTELDRKLIACAFMQPMIYSQGNNPMCLVTADDRGCGKTTLVNSIARLYKQTPVSMPLNDKEQFLARRLVSGKITDSTMVTIDNVKKKADCSLLEKLITDKHISGDRRYAGETTIINKFNFYMTCNVPSLSRDLVERSYVIHLKKPKITFKWGSEQESFMEEHRNTILAEIHHLLKTSPDPDLYYNGRFPKFYEKVMFKVIDNQEDLDILKTLQDKRLNQYDEQDDQAVLLLELLREMHEKKFAGIDYSKESNCFYMKYHDMAAYMHKHKIIPSATLSEMKMCLDPLIKGDFRKFLSMVKTNGKNRVKVNIENLYDHRQ